MKRFRKQYHGPHVVIMDGPRQMTRIVYVNGKPMTAKYTGAGWRIGDMVGNDLRKLAMEAAG